VATVLLNACIARARAEGHDRIGLHSTRYMQDAIRIYRRVGFERAPAHDFQRPAGVRVMSFRLALRPAPSIAGPGHPSV
jgi:ribosomal protein S18 acetylase RimI-like enzyme